jgi:hypothetical protein
MQTKEQFILDMWEGLEKEVVGASELSLIQDAVITHFGSAASPASIARVLADHGAPLRHPEILQADASWREKQLLFTAEDLELTSIEAAFALTKKIQQFESDPSTREHLRQAVRSLKSELDTFSTRSQLAAEVAEWLTVWLQNPQIFAEWLDLRQNTAEFRERFLS